MFWRYLDVVPGPLVLGQWVYLFSDYLEAEYGFSLFMTLAVAIAVLLTTQLATLQN